MDAGGLQDGSSPGRRDNEVVKTTAGWSDIVGRSP